MNVPIQRHIMKSCDTSVGIVTGLCAGWPRKKDFIPSRGKIFVSSVGPTQCSVQCVLAIEGGLFLWVVMLCHCVIGAQCLQIVWWPHLVIFVCWRTFQTFKMGILCCWNSCHQHDDSEEQTSTAPLQKPKNLHVCGVCFPWGMAQTIHLPFCVTHKNAWSYMPRESCVKCVSKHIYFQAASEEIVALNGQFRSGFLMLLVPSLHVIV